MSHCFNRYSHVGHILITQTTHLFQGHPRHQPSGASSELAMAGASFKDCLWQRIKINVFQRQALTGKYIELSSDHHQARVVKNIIYRLSNIIIYIVTAYTVFSWLKTNRTKNVLLSGLVFNVFDEQSTYSIIDFDAFHWNFNLISAASYWIVSITER